MLATKNHAPCGRLIPVLDQNTKAYRKGLSSLRAACGILLSAAPSHRRPTRSLLAHPNVTVIIQLSLIIRGVPLLVHSQSSLQRSPPTRHFCATQHHCQLPAKLDTQPSVLRCFPMLVHRPRVSEPSSRATTHHGQSGNPYTSGTYYVVHDYTVSRIRVRMSVDQSLDHQCTEGMSAMLSCLFW